MIWQSSLFDVLYNFIEHIFITSLFNPPRMESIPPTFFVRLREELYRALGEMGMVMPSLGICKRDVQNSWIALAAVPK
jgi:hypothetical protein